MVRELRFEPGEGQARLTPGLGGGLEQAMIKGLGAQDLLLYLTYVVC